MAYRQRVIDSTLDEAMSELAAIAIEGAKGVGKTETASRRAATVLSLNDPRARASLAGNLDVITELDSPVFIDEWQLEPDVWERVRRAVDADPHGDRRYLLAGSANPAPGARVHSGAGRIIRLTMRPMALSERGIQEAAVSLRALHAGGAEIKGITSLTVGDYADEILRSGFPGIRDLSEPNRDRQLDGYLARITDADLRDNDIAVRRPEALRAWLRAYGAATASTADYAKILNAATPGEADKPARSTADTYREHLTRLFLLDPLPAWAAAGTPLGRLGHAPKHHLADPALAARLVGIGKKGLVVGKGEVASPSAGTWLGALFESLAVQSVRVYADVMNAQVGHLRTKGGEHEVDIIVETNDQRCVALEAKLSGTIGDSDVKHLHWLQKQLGPRLIDKVVLNTGPFAYRRPDGIAVIPLALLGP